MDFVPSGNAPDIDLGAPDYDKSLADERRNNFLTMKHTIKEVQFFMVFLLFIKWI